VKRTLNLNKRAIAVEEQWALVVEEKIDGRAVEGKEVEVVEIAKAEVAVMVAAVVVAVAAATVGVKGKELPTKGQKRTTIGVEDPRPQLLAQVAPGPLRGTKVTAEARSGTKVTAEEALLQAEVRKEVAAAAVAAVQTEKAVGVGSGPAAAGLKRQQVM